MRKIRQTDTAPAYESVLQKSTRWTRLQWSVMQTLTANQKNTWERAWELVDIYKAQRKGSREAVGREQVWSNSWETKVNLPKPAPSLTHPQFHSSAAQPVSGEQNRSVGWWTDRQSNFKRDVYFMITWRWKVGHRQLKRHTKHSSFFNAYNMIRLMSLKDETMTRTHSSTWAPHLFKFIQKGKSFVDRESLSRLRHANQHPEQTEMFQLF